jgi:hypothetical protein
MANKAYDAFNPDLQAECIYLYYFTTHNAQCRVYFVDRHRYIPPAEMPEQIGSIVMQIKDGTLQPDAIGMENLPWTRKSYIAVVLDDPPARLELDDAVRFHLSPGGGNHSFRDGHDVPDVPGHTDVSAFFCFNHMRHRNGHVLKPGEKEKFRVRIVHVNKEVGAMDEHEDTGTNTGPPTPPPE